MAGENGAQIQISEERNYYFHSLIGCRVFLNWKKTDLEGKAPYIKGKSICWYVGDNFVTADE